MGGDHRVNAGAAVVAYNVRHPKGLTLTSKMYQVNGLTGSLARFNGTSARCCHSIINGAPSPLWHFLISEKITLELPRRFLRELSDFEYPIVELSHWQMIMQNDQTADHTSTSNQATANNRKDVRATADSLLMQLQNVLIERAGGGKEGRKEIGAQQIKDLFHEMDSNHNGELDKREFLVGCLNAGINISPPEINLVWPLFDTDGNGFIDTDELSSFLEARRTGRKTSCELSAVNEQLRHDRIVNKSAYAARLKATAESLQMSILELLAKERITQEELFSRLDLDDNGTLDRSEFLGGLRRQGIDLSQDDVNVIWPMFSLDSQGVVGKHEWESFLMTKHLENCWSYRMTCDLFTTNMQLAHSSVRTTNSTAAADVRRRTRHGGGFSVETRQPKHCRGRKCRPKTTAAERAVLYGPPLRVSPLPQHACHLQERKSQEGTGVHAPKPPRGGRSHCSEGEGATHTGNQTHRRNGRGHGTLRSRTIERQAQASCDGEAAPLPLLPVTLPPAMKPSPPSTRSPRNTRRCVALPQFRRNVQTTPHRTRPH